MAVLKFDDVAYEKVKEGLQRKIIHTDNLMSVLIDFSNGPWEVPEPPHSHPHEQTSYVAEGEIIFYCEGEPEQHLKAGDMFAVPSNKKHTIKLLTQKVRLIDSFTPIREDFLKEEKAISSRQ
ncbi:cupin domain-containing protein [Tangfeifania diversioriginum]|nr:cupin domain-containing protein [Tangfeifania diversioriginum]